LLHISDLHLRAAQRKKIQFLRGLARIEPDLVVSTGDLLGDAHAVPAALEAVGPLRGRVASLFVLGSNDYYSPRFKNPLRYLLGPSKPPRYGKLNPWPELVAGLQQHGWELVHNRTLRVGGIDVVGLDDPHIRRADMSVATARDGHDGFRLAVVHSPEPVQELGLLGYDLIVAGHTHGGQIRVPVYGAVVTNTHGLPRAWTRGLHRVQGGGWLHVSAGLGTSMFAPFRFACRPEVCVLELVERPAATYPAAWDESMPKGSYTYPKR
jgi:predicted MPP superfamily phosphohydrolase